MNRQQIPSLMLIRLLAEHEITVKSHTLLDAALTYDFGDMTRDTNKSICFGFIGALLDNNLCTSLVLEQFEQYVDRYIDKDGEFVQ